MIDKDKLKTLIQGQAKLSGLGATLTDDMASDVLDRAAKSVWMEYPWTFRRKQADLTADTSSGYTALPNDFGQLGNIRHVNGSTEGWKIRYNAENRYDIQFPNDDLYADDAPTMMKIVYDTADNKWKAYFTPNPNSAYTLKLTYYIKPLTVSSMPDWFEELIILKAWMFIYAPGLDQHFRAQRAYEYSVRKYEDKIDRVGIEPVDTIRVGRSFACDDGEEPWDWWNDNSVSYF